MQTHDEREKLQIEARKVCINQNFEWTLHIQLVTNNTTYQQAINTICFISKLFQIIIKAKIKYVYF